MGDWTIGRVETWKKLKLFYLFIVLTNDENKCFWSGACKYTNDYLLFTICIKNISFNLQEFNFVHTLVCLNETVISIYFLIVYNK